MVVWVSPFTQSSSFCFSCLGILWIRWGVAAFPHPGWSRIRVTSTSLVTALPMPGRTEATA